jgi:4-hydroxybenzoyl-CoA thioesterase
VIELERPVRFEDVDAAGIVFFARFFNYCHEAMEAFFGGIAGGYVGLVMLRHEGFPAVRVECDYRARIRVFVEHVGTTACTFRYDMSRLSDGASVATVKHVVVHADLQKLAKLPFDDELRALLEQHLISNTSAK